MFYTDLSAAILYSADVVVRITGDCPLVDPKIVDKAVAVFLDKNFDYVSNIFLPTYPDGLDVEVFSYSVLEQTQKNALSKAEREHVTVHMRNSGNFRLKNITGAFDNSNIRITLDEISDYNVINQVVDYFSPDISFVTRTSLTIVKIFLRKQFLKNVTRAVRWALDRSFGAELKKLFLVETCYCQKDQRCSYQKNGLPTLAARVAVQSGIWMGFLTPTSH